MPRQLIAVVGATAAAYGASFLFVWWITESPVLASTLALGGTVLVLAYMSWREATSHE